MTAKSIQPGTVAQITPGDEHNVACVAVISVAGYLHVYGSTAIRALRDACNEALGEEVKP